MVKLPGKSLLSCSSYNYRRNGPRILDLRFFSENKSKIGKKNVSPETMAPVHFPENTESGWYDWWESEGIFKPRNEGKIFTVLLPPPNVTGVLHLGHALTITLQDIYVRWMRMRGESVVWIPGLDHAGIATQTVVEKFFMTTLNLTKFDLGRKEFVQKVMDWKTEKEEKIVEQIKRMGASVDWSRKYFTMDAAHSEAVSKAFIVLYNKGLIHKQNRLVNWSCFLRSAISDIEIDRKEITQPCTITIPGYKEPIEVGYLYKFAYKVLNDDKEGDELIVATTRPETMLGDTALAVHPDDVRYSHLKDKFVWHPFRNCKIPIIFDGKVKPDLGSGVLKITPACSAIDYEIGRRFNLEIVEVIDESGLIKNMDHFSIFQGMKRFTARKKILNELQNLGLYKGRENYSMEIPFCGRSGDIIEYLLKPQWFLNCDGMTKKVRSAILNDNISFQPVHCKKVLLEWFNHTVDWNLSRQLWWGHRIPVYECKFEDEILNVPALSPEEAKLIASKKLGAEPSEISAEQDPDVLDTWFSSGILPFSVNGWPHTLGQNGSYPLSLMETGHDIVYFWVARMLMLGLEITGQLPFSRVILHGLICDSHGRKMSKSAGNIVLPEEIIRGCSLEEMKANVEKNFRCGILNKEEFKKCIDSQTKMFPSGIPECGADALRLTFCTEDVTKDFLNFDIQLCKSSKSFCNKIWQASIFLRNSALERPAFRSQIERDSLSIFDAWILSSLSTTVRLVNEGISNFRFYIAVTAIKDFFVRHFCDIYLESSKLTLCNSSDEDTQRVLSVLFKCLETSLHLMSPFVPFVSEELYHCLPKPSDYTPAESLTIAPFPDVNYWREYQDSEIDRLMFTFINILSALRSIRDVYKLSRQNVKVILSCPNELDGLFNHDLIRFLKKYTKVGDISRGCGEILDRNVITQVVDNCAVHVYHEYDRHTLMKMFAPILLKEAKIRETLEKLSESISEPEYESQTTAEIRDRTTATISNLKEKLKKIEILKEVITKTER